MTSFGSCAVETPIGSALVVASSDGLVAVRVGSAERAAERLAREHRIVADDDRALATLVQPQFDEYFAGLRRSFDIELDWRLVDGFSREALQAVCEIPYGETAAYGEVAAMAGRPRAARAVGTACRTTPFSLVVPVHRVIRSDGSLGEYGGNTEAKRFLVELERSSSESRLSEERHK